MTTQPSLKWAGEQKDIILERGKRA